MPRIEKYLIQPFTDQPKEVYVVSVPDNSVFLNKVKVLHDGIYGFYSLSEIILSTAGVRHDRYAIVRGTDSIPDNADLIDILDVIMEVPDESGQGAEPTQGIMIFPVYKLR